MSWFRRAYYYIKSKIVKTPTKRPTKPVTVTSSCPPEIAIDYTRLLDGLKFKALSSELMELIYSEMERFKKVEDVTFVPWQVIAFITIRETGYRRKDGKLSLKLERCLHNGDRWDRVTTHVPRGLGPWASWEEAAADALNRKRRPSNWTAINTLWFLEKYNGLGYRKYHSHVKSPYLWSGTDRYTRGGYASDGKWSDRYVSKQYGAVQFLLAFKQIDSTLINLKGLSSDNNVS